MIEIVNWDQTFENADTRKRQRLKSFHCPSGIDSRGLMNLLCHFDNKDALAAFGVFQLICQFVATHDAKRRGRLLHSDFTPMTPDFVSRVLRVEICHLSAALEILADKRVAWIRIHDSADDLPVTCHQSPGFVQVEGEVEVEGEGVADGTLPADPGDFAESHPTETAKRFEEIQRWINSIHPSWKKRPAFTRQELEDLRSNARIFFDLTDDDQELIRAYMAALIPPEWGKFWQPDTRGMFVRSISDLLAHADRWKTKSKREGVPTGILT